MFILLVNVWILKMPHDENPYFAFGMPINAENMKSNRPQFLSGQAWKVVKMSQSQSLLPYFSYQDF